MKKLAFVFLLSSVFCLTAQAQWGGVKGQGSVIEKNIQVPSFKGVKLAFSGNVVLKQGSTQSVKVEGQENIIDLISTEVRDGIWKLKFTKNVRNYKKLNVYITVPSLKYVGVSGSGNIKTENNFTNLGDLEVKISGSGNIKFEGQAQSLKTSISGSGNMKLRGSANEVYVRISGSGNINTSEVKTANCEVKISGSGDAKVYASDKLNVRVSGSGDVMYYGQPKIKSKITGSGDLVAKSGS